jgi:hypothetical protein
MRTSVTVVGVVALLFVACAPGGNTQQTEAVLAHHLEAVGQGNLDEIMADYAADAVLYTPNGPLRGHDEIRPFFASLSENLPKEFWEAFTMVRQDVDGEVAYIVWAAGSIAPLGTDTFIVRQNKILVQTFAAHMPPAE